MNLEEVEMLRKGISVRTYHSLDFSNYEIEDNPREIITRLYETMTRYPSGNFDVSCEDSYFSITYSWEGLKTQEDIEEELLHTIAIKEKAEAVERETEEKIKTAEKQQLVKLLAKYPEFRTVC